jgi:hypothetical protein
VSRPIEWGVWDVLTHLDLAGLAPDAGSFDYRHPKCYPTIELFVRGCDTGELVAEVEAFIAGGFDPTKHYFELEPCSVRAGNFAQRADSIDEITELLYVRFGMSIYRVASSFYGAVRVHSWPDKLRNDMFPPRRVYPMCYNRTMSSSTFANLMDWTRGLPMSLPIAAVAIVYLSYPLRGA